MGRPAKHPGGVRLEAVALVKSSNAASGTTAPMSPELAAVRPVSKIAGQLEALSISVRP